MNIELSLILACAASALVGVGVGAWAQAQRAATLRDEPCAFDDTSDKSAQLVAASSCVVDRASPTEGVTFKRTSSIGSVASPCAFAQAQEDLVRRIASATRQAVQVELDFHARGRIHHEDQCRAQSLRWQLQHETRLGEIHSLLRSLAANARAAPPLPRVVTSPSDAVHNDGPDGPTSTAELDRASHAALELSDEDIDNLPAELPHVDPPRRRRLPAPKVQQPLHRL